MSFSEHHTFALSAPRAVHPTENGYITYASLEAEGGKKFMMAEFYDNEWRPGEEKVELGANLNAENPTIVNVGGKVFVTFSGDSPFDNQDTCMWLHEHGTARVKPLYVTSGMAKVEKNWAPLVYKGKLLFVYSFDPYVVLQCDTDTGKCVTLMGTLPCDVGRGVIRGSTGIIDTGEFMEGFCVSKHRGHVLTHKVRLSKKLDLLRIGEPVLYGGTHGPIPRSFWWEHGRSYVSAGPSVYTYSEKSWNDKVKDMVDTLAFAESSDVDAPTVDPASSRGE
jgi:hypothetical protein